ncbi:hypothetical protein N015_01810 [Pseudomonas asturiensis]|uniref:YtxH-like protein n=1 Tax=Pseudomonas asturiensis TaxID=1190415 RepID=A0ABX6H6U3_9PSED|nr:hypothetical protein [Pseudomonas asturiensis]QHF01206.1 hypothetical protein N015_01810 [Pseudomonas asturiensis]
MQTEHLSGSDWKASTRNQKLLAMAVIGGALIGYQVHKTPDARTRLEQLTNEAHGQGDITDQDAEIVAQLLAKTPIPFLVQHRGISHVSPA